ncbi:MAG: gliding motility protein GldN [Bacteroidaceae bacterium]|jgi:gliding motility associated protien GldN|nr:gliding motility protein GldN [Bacteroidaceae bacterium]MBP5348518.1 gliding motility protein GldN [Bacteroidaceae bacterium]MBR4593826.1 gliding motility protein GldN [Bacteroidaceae bacterium]
MKKSVLLILTLAMATIASAQPARRLQEQAAQKEAEKSPTAVTLTDRARSQYTAQTAVPTELTWRRDIYRELDLKKEKNAALYYPEEPLGDRVNFFTLVLNLILDGKIKAYEYRLDGNELFTPDNELDLESMLDKFYIDYKKDEKGKYIIDIPSRDIGKYYIKESNYLDKLSNYQTKVTAICPVLMQGGYGDKPTAYPMFWLNYDEISPYLGQTQVMTSSYNNTSNMSLDDYFVMRQYEGEIYKTSNLRNQPLSEYCETDSALQAERERIEKQLIDFQNGLWNDADNTAVTEKTQNTSAGKSQKEPRQPKEKKEKAPRAPRQSASSGERISVHR